jgi:hypothetical protein
MQPQANTKPDYAALLIPPPVFTAADDVKDVIPLPGRRLAVRFHDGVTGIVDMAGLIDAPDAGVFAALRDPAVFAQVAVEFGAVTWPGEIDLAPDAMHDALKEQGEWILSA